MQELGVEGSHGNGGVPAVRAPGTGIDLRARLLKTRVPGTVLRGMSCWPLLTLSVAYMVARGAPSQASTLGTCDTDFVRMEAQQSFPEYQVGPVRANQGIVTLLFTQRNDVGMFAVALRASGTQLFTSVTGVRLDRATLARVSEPVTLWWQNADLQRALAACSEAMPGEAIGDLAAALQRAAEAALPRTPVGATIFPFSPVMIPPFFPRSVALALALFQVAVLAAAISRGISIDASRYGPAQPSSSAPAFALEPRGSWIALLVIAACALVAVHRFGGPSAEVWEDTFNDQVAVQRCLEHSECTIYGMGTSVPGFSAAGGWLQLRDLLSALGLSMDQQYLLMQVLDALGVMLAAFAAWRLGGPAAAALATWAIWNHLGMAGVNYHALFNPIIMPFLGAVYLVACAHAVERPSAGSVVTAALVGAILANVRFSGLACGITAVWIGLLAPQQRIRLAVISCAAFVLGTLAISPGTWLQAASYVLSHPGGVRQETANVHLLGEPLAVDGIWVIVIWLVTRLLGWRFGKLRRRLDAPMAIIAPPLGVFFLAGLLGRINGSVSYVAHLRAPVAVALALGVVGIGGGLVRFAIASSSRIAPLRRLWATTRVLRYAVPYLGAATLLVCQPSNDGGTLRLLDIQVVARIVREDFRWDFATALHSFKAPNDRGIFRGWMFMYPDWARRPFGPGRGDDPRVAVLLEVSRSELPDPVPKEWRIVPVVSGSDVMVLALVPSWIDWTHYKVCRSSGDLNVQRCVDTGLFVRPDDDNQLVLDAMPDRPEGEHLRLRFPLRTAGSGEVHEVFMPRHPPQMCPGRIVSVPEGSRVDGGGRHATLVSAPAAAAAPELAVEWDLGACPVGGYSGFPPFFVEGDAEAVRPLVEAMKRWER